MMQCHCQSPGIPAMHTGQERQQLSHLKEKMCVHLQLVLMGVTVSVILGLMCDRP